EGHETERNQIDARALHRSAVARTSGRSNRSVTFPMLPKLESLRCFEQAAASLCFRRAAASVGLSPTAFGERIRDLEDQLGRRLFIRTARQVLLTTDG